ncbi:hypothetical protein AIOL_000114 [Candidatus Rhodobacter oscarellae]|uniref:Uncharacterized protein n=1 Tax=Candidatus Rhodobacter oscarellae TaxID=1675527 RepID=A0A0J9EB04_9RHOB|nr:hypothetical protein AIOL_000114 [Candidatus Rhodobacter lobularis]
MKLMSFTIDIFIAAFRKPKCFESITVCSQHVTAHVQNFRSH